MVQFSQNLARYTVICCVGCAIGILIVGMGVMNHPEDEAFSDVVEQVGPVLVSRSQVFSHEFRVVNRTKETVRILDVKDD